MSKHYFKQLSDIISNDLKFSSNDVIKRANNLLKKLFIEVTNSRKEFQFKRLLERSNEDTKILLCYDIFGHYNYWNFNSVSVDFLLWIKKTVSEDYVTIGDVKYWDWNYEQFIEATHNQPNNFEDLIKWDNLSLEDQLLINIKHNCKPAWFQDGEINLKRENEIFKRAYKRLKN